MKRPSCVVEHTGAGLGTWGAAPPDGAPGGYFVGVMPNRFSSPALSFMKK